MTDMASDLTDNTLEMIRKAQTAGVTSAMGLYGFDLSGPASLVPANTPWYDHVKRVNSSDGAKFATWRTLLNVNATQPNPFTGFDQGGQYVNFSEMDMFAPYAPVRVTGRVFRDAMDLSKGYADAHALAVFGTLGQWRVQENKALLGGQAFPLPSPTTPVVTSSTTGGSIGTGVAIPVRVAARSAMNYYWGGSGIASAAGTVTSGAGSTNSGAATTNAVRGASAYDWYVNGFYYTTTVTNVVTITSIPTAHAVVVPNLPSLYTVAPTAVPAVDTSYSLNSYNGLIASCAGDYGPAGLVTAGSGVNSGCAFTSLNGGTLTANSQGVAEIDNMLLAIWNASQLSPTSIIINGQQAQDIKAKILGTNAAVTYLRGGEAGDRDGVIGGGAVAGYVNGASGGDHVGIISDPALPPGRIGFITEQLNYPNQGFANTFEARCLRDVSEFPYGVGVNATPGANGGPREEWDVSSTETFINRAPVACGWLTEIAAG